MEGAIDEHRLPLRALRHEPACREEAPRCSIEREHTSPYAVKSALSERIDDQEAARLPPAAPTDPTRAAAPNLSDEGVQVDRVQATDHARSTAGHDHTRPAGRVRRLAGKPR